MSKQENELSFLKLDGVPSLVWANIENLKSPLSISEYIKESKLIQDHNLKPVDLKEYSQICMSLGKARLLKPETLIKNQDFYKERKKVVDDEEKKYTEEELKNLLIEKPILDSLKIKLTETEVNVSNTIEKFINSLFKVSVVVGFIEYGPRGILEYKIPEGKNAILYDAAKFRNNYELDLTNSKPTPIKWPITYGERTKDLTDLVGTENYYILADENRVIEKNNNSMAAVCCRFSLTSIVIDSICPIDGNEGEFGTMLIKYKPELTS